jgi:hypothetical protein
MPQLVQSAYNTVAKYQSRTCTVTFDEPSKPGSLLIVICAAAGTIPTDLTNPRDGNNQVFTKIGKTGAVSNPNDQEEVWGLRDIQLTSWYTQNAPVTRSVSVTALDDNKSQQLYFLEYTDMAQANVLDKVTGRQAENRDPFTGSTGTIAQADELILGIICNQYASTSQFGFKGDLSRLFESVSPQKYGNKTNQDWERSRVSIHQQISTTAGNYSLECDLSTTRRWMTYLITFRGGTTGPVKITSTQQTQPMISTDGHGDLSVFGPLKSGVDEDVEIPPMIQNIDGGGHIGPFNYQYRLGNWNGLLIGSGTNYHVQDTDGLNGWTIRTSDEDRPRADGAYRGIDLSDARNVIFNMNVGRGRDEVERNMDTLYRALIPQRDTDWELIWRHPTHGLKMMRVRPGDLVRDRNNRQLIFSKQRFVLRAADPRHYSAIEIRKEIQNTPSSLTNDPPKTQVFNIGNSPAYPVIMFEGPSSGDPVSRIELINETALVNLELELTLQKGGFLICDMDARVTGVPRSIITLDGQSKYGAWQLPREPFRIDPDPTGFGGFNEVYLRTIPEGAPIKCTMVYRDTWYG